MYLAAERAVYDLVLQAGGFDPQTCRIDDWRYRGSWDSIMTHLYACELTDGEPQASDDIAELRWFEVDRLKEDAFVPEHRPLWELLLEFLEEE